MQQGEPSRAGVATHAARRGAAGAAGASRLHSAAPLPPRSLLSQHPRLVAAVALASHARRSTAILCLVFASTLLLVLAGATVSLRLKCENISDSRVFQFSCLPACRARGRSGRHCCLCMARSTRPGAGASTSAALCRSRVGHVGGQPARAGEQAAAVLQCMALHKEQLISTYVGV